jgi:DNA-binding transcriptional LysR family regulator
MDWDDLRFVLEVCRSGSALAAAGKLGVNQSTVMRRIAQAEEALGVELFERKQSGYVPTPNGLCVADAAGRIEREVHEVQSAMASVQRVLAGTVRFTSSDLLANTILASCLGPFQKLNQGIRVELITDDRRLDIAHGEADVALRAGSRPDGAGIVMRRMPVRPGRSIAAARTPTNTAFRNRERRCVTTRLSAWRGRWRSSPHRAGWKTLLLASRLASAATAS